MTKDELRELESAPKTPFQIFIDRLVCFSPVIAGALALAEYYMIPNLPGNESTDVYAYFIGVLMAAVFAVSFGVWLILRRIPVVNRWLI